jgi:two-component system chemotaxis response regulator CheY
MKFDSELGTPSITSTQDCFSSLSIVVGHTEPKASAGARTVLHSLGCRKIVFARTNNELISCVRRDHCDLAVVDWWLRETTGAQAIRKLRQSHGMPNRDLPVILLVPEGQEDAVRIAREAGANEIVKKPVTARDLLISIYTVIVSPRAFIVTADYAGPDRRVKSSVSSGIRGGEKVAEKRQCPAVTVASVDRADELPVGTAVIVAPDYRIRRKMGLTIPDTPGVLAPSPPQLTALHTASPIDAQVGDLGALVQQLLLSPQGEGDIIAAIRSSAESIAQGASERGHRRIFQVARLLVNFCDRYFIKGNRASSMLLEKHADTLGALVRIGPDAAAGELGEMLVKELAVQVEVLIVR